MPLMKNKNKTVAQGSPCFTPIFDSIKGDNWELYLTFDFTTEYMLLTAEINFELMFSLTNLTNSKLWSILSKHFSKSKKAQYSFRYYGM